MIKVNTINNWTNLYTVSPDLMNWKENKNTSTVFLPRLHKSKANHKERADKPKLMNILSINWPTHFKICQYHKRQRKNKEFFQIKGDMITKCNCLSLDQILNQISFVFS